MSMASMKKWMMASEFDLIVVGGGAAGLFSAGTAAGFLRRVLLLERNRDLGRKLRITGKGRCNILNDCQPEDVLKHVTTGNRFLYSSVFGFPPNTAKDFFEGLGLPLKTERGKRVFPVSDQAEDVVEVLEKWVHSQRVQICHGRARELLIRGGKIAGVKTDEKVYYAPRVILATGGMSYPATGSTGDGYILAAQAGHTISSCSGSLVPLEVEGGCRNLAGLNLRNTGVTLRGKQKKPVYQDFGELLFMNYGLSGPTILSCSAHVDEKIAPYIIELDLKPALDDGRLDSRLLCDFETRKNKSIYDGLRGVLPAKLVPLILERSGIATNRVVHEITRKERYDIIQNIKHLRFTVVGKRPVEEAIITHGGVNLIEVNPKTMESKKVSGLYFAGEILDCDAYTGGFNLQIAWSTAYAAGTSCGNSKNAVL